MNNAHQDKLDMLRGFASIAVLLPHSSSTYLQRLLGSDHPVVLAGGTIARHAVLVFFLLSGFLITQSILANFRRNGGFDVADYLSARIARIYPPLIGAIVIVITAYAVIHGFELPGAVRYGVAGDLFAVRDSFKVGLKDVISSMLMLNGLLDANGPLWSLYIEFHLYIAAVFVSLAVAANKSSVRATWATIAVAFLAFWIKRDNQFAFYMAVWVLGACVAVWHRQLTISVVATIIKVLGWLILMTYLITAVAMPGVLIIDKPSPLISFGVQFAACIAYVHFIFMSKNFVRKPPALLLKTADFSYSLYVIHFPLLLLTLSFTQEWMGSSMSRALIVFVSASFAAIVSSAYFARFFENQRRFKPPIRTALNAVFKFGERVTMPRAKAP